MTIKQKVKFGNIGRVIKSLENVADNYVQTDSIFRLDALSIENLKELGRKNYDLIVDDLLPNLIEWIKSSFAYDCLESDRPNLSRKRKSDMRKSIRVGKDLKRKIEEIFSWDSDIYGKLDPTKPIIPYRTWEEWLNYFKNSRNGSTAYVFSPTFSNYNVDIDPKANKFVEVRIEGLTDLPSLIFEPLEPLFLGKNDVGRCDPQSPSVIPAYVLDYLTIHRDYRDLWLSFVNPNWKNSDKYVKGIKELTEKKVKQIISSYPKS